MKADVCNRFYSESETGGEDILYCFICSYRWRPKKDTPPKKCPKCRSMKWNQEFASVLRACKRCGHTWRSSFPESRKCPSCQSVRWDDDSLDLECLRCGHTWETRSEGISRKCPRCRSPKWNVPVRMFECGKCGHTMVIKSNTREGMCPICQGNIQRHECSRCGHTWDSSRGRMPKKCPACGSRKWPSPNFKN